MNIADIYRDDLMATARHPDNVGKLKNPDVILTEYNTSCGDQVTVTIKLDSKGLKVADLKWQGSGCMVSQAAMSQVSNLIIGQTIKKIQNIKLDELLKDMGLEEITPARKRCAQLGLTAVKKALLGARKSIKVKQKKPGVIFVGSVNPVKINATSNAIAHKWSDVEVVGQDVSSQVSEQPLTDEETKAGSVNRAKAVLKKGLEKLCREKKDLSGQTLGVGIEGGVYKNNEELWNTVWVSVADSTGHVFSANGARFQVPEEVAKPILAGEEMGPILSKLMGGQDVRRTNGFIGVVTKDFVDRTDEYTAIAKIALGLWYGQGWQKNATKIRGKK